MLNGVLGMKDFTVLITCFALIPIIARAKDFGDT